MAKTYKSIVINASVGSGSSFPPHTQSFNATSSWTLNGSDYEITVLESNHSQGANVLVQVYELVGTDYQQVIVDVVKNSIGNVTIKVNASPDLRFEGKLVIKGD